MRTDMVARTDPQLPSGGGSGAAVEVLGEVSSKSHPAQWKLLTRVVQGPRATKFPEIARLFGTGSNEEKKEVLKKFLTAGENLESCEATFQVARRHRDRLTRGREELTVKQMVERRFTEYLRLPGCSLFPSAFRSMFDTVKNP